MYIFFFFKIQQSRPQVPQAGHVGLSPAEVCRILEEFYKSEKDGDTSRPLVVPDLAARGIQRAVRADNGRKAQARLI